MSIKQIIIIVGVLLIFFFIFYEYYSDDTMPNSADIIPTESKNIPTSGNTDMDYYVNVDNGRDLSENQSQPQDQSMAHPTDINSNDASINQDTQGGELTPPSNNAIDTPSYALNSQSTSPISTPPIPVPSTLNIPPVPTKPIPEQKKPKQTTYKKGDSGNSGDKVIILYSGKDYQGKSKSIKENQIIELATWNGIDWIFNWNSMQITEGIYIVFSRDMQNITNHCYAVGKYDVADIRLFLTSYPVLNVDLNMSNTGTLRTPITMQIVSSKDLLMFQKKTYNVCLDTMQTANKKKADTYPITYCDTRRPDQNIYKTLSVYS